MTAILAWCPDDVPKRVTKSVQSVEGEDHIKSGNSNLRRG